MYWFQDIESARALARLWSASPNPLCEDGVPQSNPDEPAMDDVAGEAHEDATVTPCSRR
jgi:hypothetical protein